MRIEGVELFLLRLPYVHYFETSFGREYDRTFIIAAVSAEGRRGYGEVAASQSPLYSYETTATAWHVLKDFFIPLLFREDMGSAQEFYKAARRFRGHPMAKAGLEAALWDLEAKIRGLPLSRIYGGVRKEIPAGVSIGIQDSVSDLLKRIDGFIKEGYRRVKIKIKPGWDIGICRKVRENFPHLVLQADANGAYSPEDRAAVLKLDNFGLLLLEQVFPPYDLWDHAQLQKEMKTPLCLDESILDLTTARQAAEMESCRIINIKPGRVGGIVEARKIHDFCRERKIPVWCGGMLESGIGRAHNLHLASLPNFTLPADLSASRRYYSRDIVAPEIILTERGTVPVPEGPGIGVVPDEERMRSEALQHKNFSPKSI